MNKLEYYFENPDSKIETHEWKYLGDGVYAIFDGFHIILVTHNPQKQDDICLNPDVFAALVEFGKSKFDEPTSS